MSLPDRREHPVAYANAALAALCGRRYAGDAWLVSVRPASRYSLVNATIDGEVWSVYVNYGPSKALDLRGPVEIEAANVLADMAPDSVDTAWAPGNDGNYASTSADVIERAVASLNR